MIMGAELVTEIVAALDGFNELINLIFYFLDFKWLYEVESRINETFKIKKKYWF